MLPCPMLAATSPFKPAGYSTLSAAFANSFRTHTYQTPRKHKKQSTYTIDNSIRINTYKSASGNSFRIHTYEKQGGGGPPSRGTDRAHP
jgi:hypothetical protein